MQPAKPSFGPAALAVISVWLPLRFMVLGLLSLFAGTALLVIHPPLLATYHYNQHVIAVTHLFTLGFVASIIMGAMYQLVPVALETRLHSERLARWQFVLHATGMTGMVWMFWHWNIAQVGHFASVLTVGIALFAYNMVRTLATVPRWNPTATAVASALAWLGLTALAGLALATAKLNFDPEESTTAANPWRHGLETVSGWLGHFDPIARMHAHAHLGGVGFFLLLIVGISYRLVPMFTLSEVQSRRRAATSIWLLNGGLAGLVPSLLLRSPWKFVFAAVLAAGVTVYFVELRAILRARQRRAQDWGLLYFFTALAALGACTALGLVLSWPWLPANAFTGQLENLYGFTALFGGVALAILGMLYKILPFLVWYARYSPDIGRRKVPSLSDLYSPRLQAAGYWTFLAGMIATGIAILAGSTRAMPAGCGLLAASLVIFAANAARILSHLVHTRRNDLVRVPNIAPDKVGLA
ncbi:MAG: hypothetical protein U1F98_08620 [Verrucomicrobiota bacterium]